jgi:hypothetical protein
MSMMMVFLGMYIIVGCFIIGLCVLVDPDG